MTASNANKRGLWTGTSAERDALTAADGLLLGDEFWDTAGGKAWWDGAAWRGYTTDGAAHVAEVGIPSTRHNRYVAADITTHPGDDTEAVTWTQAENVRRYRLFPVGTAGDLLKVVEDAANATQADAWLTLTEALDVDCPFWVAAANEWSEWKELSKNPSDSSLSRLDFEVIGTGITDLYIEAE